MKRIPWLVVVWLLVPSMAAAQQSDWESAEATGGSAEGDSEVAGPNQDVWGDPNRRDDDDDDDGRRDDDDDDDDDDDEIEFEGVSTGLQGSFELWAELGMWGGEYDFDQMATMDAFLLSPIAGMAYYVVDFVRIGAEVGLAFLIHGDIAGPLGMEAGGVSFRVGDPRLFGEFLGETDDFRYRASVGLTIPVLGAGTTGERAALSLSTGIRGGWDAWLWAERRLSIVAEGGIELDATDELMLEAEVGFAPMFFVGDGRGDTLIAFQVAIGAEYAFSEVVHLGGRLTGVLGEDVLPERESFQLAFEPYGRFDFGPGSVVVGMILNVTPPYGFSFIEGNPWGLRLGFDVVL